MMALVAATPLLAIATSIVVFNWPPIRAAALGAAVALALLAWRDEPEAAQDAQLLVAALVLSANAAAVIGPGLFFVSVTQRQGAGDALAHWLQALPAPTGLKVVLLVVGVAPLIESLTGFGVSLVTVPAALALLPRARALRVALLSVNIMPWGTLALATLVGSELAGVAPRVLGPATALTSSLIYPAAALLATLVAGERAPTRLVQALLLGAGVSAILWAASAWIGIALAGVLAGAGPLTAVAAGLTMSGKRGLSPPRAAWPYGALLAAMLALRLSQLAFPNVSAVAVTAGSASWAPLRSPGLPLLLVALAAAPPRAWPSALRIGLGQAIKSVATVALFLLTAQAMVAGELIARLTPILDRLDAAAGLALVAIFALLAGYLTGSNMGGNALLMGPAAALGEAHGAPVLYAAVQKARPATVCSQRGPSSRCWLVWRAPTGASRLS